MKKKGQRLQKSCFKRGGIFLLCFLLSWMTVGPLMGQNVQAKKAQQAKSATLLAKKSKAEIQDQSLDDYSIEKSPEEEASDSDDDFDKNKEDEGLEETDVEAAEETARSLKKFFTYYDEVPIMLIGTVDHPDVVMGKNIDKPAGIASMTKLMTYYLAKEDISSGKVNLEDEVKISEEAAELNKAGYSNYGLEAGDKMPLSQLIYGMMTVSGNDAAMAIAEYLGGSEKAFVKRMNKTAQELGLKSMHFVNASGITFENGKYNQSSARDLYRFSLKLIKKYPEIKDFSEVKQVEEEDRDYSHPSTFYQYMKDIPGLKGLKTGNSKEAGHCFAGWFDIHSEVTDSDYELITILMGAPSNDARWRTSLEMVETAAGSFANLKLVDEDKPVDKYEIPGSREGAVDLYPAQSFTIFSYTNADYEVHYEIEPGIEAPSKAGQEFGKISVLKDGELIKEIPVVAEEGTDQESFMQRLSQSLERFMNFLSSLA